MDGQIVSEDSGLRVRLRQMSELRGLIGDMFHVIRQLDTWPEDHQGGQADVPEQRLEEKDMDQLLGTFFLSIFLLKILFSVDSNELKKWGGVFFH